MTSTERLPFGERLDAAMAEHGPLCVGIDPHPGLLAAWGLPHSVSGVARFASICVEAFGGQVAMVKPQSAFFEVFGSAGIAVLETTLAGLRDAGTLSLLDVKRGDIGSTMTAYAQAYLSDDAALRADAITVSPYLGVGTLAPAFDLAEATGRGVFVLALTSNPEGARVQHAHTGLGSVAGEIVADVTARNAAQRSAGRLGSVGMVVGATVGAAVADLGLDLTSAAAPLLAPGLGAQGGTVAGVREAFGAATRFVLASSSREVLSTGPDPISLRRAAGTVASSLRALRQA
ncbi:MAG: orotidine-5'-phosphate decarboxylase [Nostocoides sp.]